jgi:hypothetical protein
MEILRTPDARFVSLPDFSFAPHYLEVTNAGGPPLRIHYLDEGPSKAFSSEVETGSRQENASWQATELRRGGNLKPARFPCRSATARSLQV